MFAGPLPSATQQPHRIAAGNLPCKNDPDRSENHPILAFQPDISKIFCSQESDLRNPRSAQKNRPFGRDDSSVDEQGRLDRFDLATDATATVQELAAALGTHPCTESERTTTFGVALAAWVMHCHRIILSNRLPSSMRVESLSPSVPVVQFDPYEKLEFIGQQAFDPRYWYEMRGRPESLQTHGPSFGVCSQTLSERSSI